MGLTNSKYYTVKKCKEILDKLPDSFNVKQLREVLDDYRGLARISYKVAYAIAETFVSKNILTKEKQGGTNIYTKTDYFK